MWKKINELVEYDNKLEDIIYDEDEYIFSDVSKKFIIILGVLLLIISIMYVIFGLYIDYKFIYKDEILELSSDLSDNTILAFDSLNQKEKEYYVYFYDFDNEVWYISNFIYDKIGDIKIYEVDLGNDLNKNYISNESNRYAKDIDDLKVVGNTLIKVSNGKIVKYYEGNEIYIFNLDNSSEYSGEIKFTYVD